MQRQAGAPALLDADIVADVREQGTCAAAVLRGIRAGVAAALADFSAHLDEHIGRCQPFELHAVLIQLVAPQYRIHQRLIDKIPGVGMLLIQITQPREEAAELEVEAIVQRIGLHEGVFHTGTARGQQRYRCHAAEQRVDVGRKAQLRFAEVETLLMPRNGIHGKARDGDCRVALQIAIRAGKDEREGRVEGIRACRLGGRSAEGMTQQYGDSRDRTDFSEHVSLQ